MTYSSGQVDPNLYSDYTGTGDNLVDYSYKSPEEEFEEGDLKPVKAGEQGTARISNAVDSVKESLPSPSGDLAKEALSSTLQQGYITNPVAPILTGLIDFGLDAVGHIPATQSIDDAWDEHTKFQNPILRQLRSMAAVIVPTTTASAVLGPAAGSAVGKVTGGSAILSGLATLGTNVAADVAVTGISDYSERDDGLMRGLDELLEDWGNPLGMSIPDAWQVLDGDSMEVRKQKLMFESAGLSIFGDALGYLLSARKPVMTWFKAKDEVAESFKAREVMTNPDPSTVKTVASIDNQIDDVFDEVEEIAAGIEQAQGKGLQIKEEDMVMLLERRNELIKRRQLLEQQKAVAVDEYKQTNGSSAAVDPLESAVEQQQISRDWQKDYIAASKIAKDPEGTNFEPFVNRELVEESSTFTPSIPKGNVVKNAADVAASVHGVAKGVPAPFTEPMLMKGLELEGSSRDVIKAIADDYASAGNYEATISGFRFTKEQIDNASWQRQAEIIDADSADELKKLFKSRRDIKHLADGVSTTYINEQDAVASARALRHLADLFLGKEITESSNRFIDTTAEEVSAMAQAYDKFKGSVDPDRIESVILDKIQLISEEYGLNKYIAGWALNNKKFWPGKAVDRSSPQKVLEEFSSFKAKNRARAKMLRKNIEEVRQKNPAAAKALMMAFGHSNGNIHSLDQLTKYMSDQMSMTGMIYSKGPQMNMFARGLWSVRYNNVLSGISAFRAGIGGAAALTLKPIEYFTGSGMGALMGEGFGDFKRGWYAFGGIVESQKRALADGFNMYQLASKEARSVMDMVRTDLKFDDVATWAVLDAGEEALKASDNWSVGQRAKLNWMRVNQEASLNPWMRYGTNAMLAIDAYSASLSAHANARFRAYDTVITKLGKSDERTLLAAERHYRDQIFDKSGRVRDAWTKAETGDIALNLDNQVSSFLGIVINKMPILKPFMMFSTTSTNLVPKAMSYIPFTQNLPWMQKVGKAIAAETTEEMDEVLALHKIDPKDPQKELIVRNLKLQYRGRVGLGIMTASSLMHFGLTGNIRGNWPMDSNERRRLANNKWQAKTINIGGNWVSYEGLPMLDPILTIIGDLNRYANDIGETTVEENLARVAWTIAATFVSNTPVKGLEPLVQLAGGDQAAFTRFAANETRSWIPLSGAMGVVAKGLDSSLKDIYNDLQGQIFNRIPVLNSTLTPQGDVWTGQPINDIDNPILRMANALSPIKVSAGPEPWRQWLIDSGFDGINILRKTSDGKMDYDPETRNKIISYMGEDQLWRQVDKLRQSKKYNDQLDLLRSYRSKNIHSDFSLDERDLDSHQILRKLLRESQVKAEKRLLGITDPKHPDFGRSQIMKESILGQHLVDKYMDEGDVNRAAKASMSWQQKLDYLRQNFK